MSSIIVRSFDPETGIYTGDTVAFSDPVEPGNYNIPGNATQAALPAIGANQTAVWDGAAWSLVPDYRGWRGYAADGTAVMITTAGIAPEADWSITPPPPSPEELMARLRAERDSRIDAVVWRYQRHARDLRMGRAPSDDIAVLDAYVQALADMPETTTDPAAPEWPEMPQPQ